MVEVLDRLDSIALAESTDTFHFVAILEEFFILILERHLRFNQFGAESEAFRVHTILELADS